jgi:hypothetical protein
VHGHTRPHRPRRRAAALPHCYDHTAHLVKQWWAPELWRRFTIALRRRIANHLGLSEKAARERLRVQFAKVAEFQRRGIVHFHALIRLDGSPTDTEHYPPPTVDLDSTTLARLVRSAAAAIWYDGPARARSTLPWAAEVARVRPQRGSAATSRQSYI